MPIQFTPNGLLDPQTDPLDLPSTMAGKTEVSGAMTRCTNLTLDTMGQATTRPGSARVGGVALGKRPSLIYQLDGNRYEFSGSTIYQNEVSIETELTESNWSATAYNAYNSLDQQLFALNGTDRVRINGSTVSNWGIAAPTVAPTCYADTQYAITASIEEDQVTDTRVKTIADVIMDTTSSLLFQTLHDWEGDQLAGSDVVYTSGSTLGMWWYESYGLDATWQICYTYCRKSGDVLECESNPSPAKEISIISGLWATWTASTDSQVTHVRFYRTLANQASFYYIGEFAIDAGLSNLDVLDEALGTELSQDHDRPPAGSHVIGPNYNGLLFILDGNNVYYSLAKQPEYWPALNYIEVGPIHEPLVSGCFLGGILYLASKNEIYQLQGTSGATLFPLPMTAYCGTQSRWAFVPVQGQGIFHLGYDGIYQFAPGRDTKITQGRFDAIFQGTTVGSIPGVNLANIANCWILYAKGKIFFGYPDSDSTYANNMLVFDLKSGRPVHYSYPFDISSVFWDNDNDRILGYASSGYVWELDKAGEPDDGGTAISWQIETKEFGGLRKYFPRYSRYDVALNSDDATASALVLLDGITKQTHAITSSRATRKRLIDTCTGDRLSIRCTGTGPATIYSLEAE